MTSARQQKPRKEGFRPQWKKRNTDYKRTPRWDPTATAAATATAIKSQWRARAGGGGGDCGLDCQETSFDRLYSIPDLCVIRGRMLLLSTFVQSILLILYCPSFLSLLIVLLWILLCDYGYDYYCTHQDDDIIIMILTIILNCNDGVNGEWPTGHARKRPSPQNNFDGGSEKRKGR